MVLILGPCVIESEDHALFMALMIRSICRRLGLDFIFKASFDKANRTSVDSCRGPGLEEGLRILQHIKQEVGCPITSDIHEVGQAEAAAAVLDVIQIPALLSRQTDLITAAGRTGKTINIKKGQMMAPGDMGHAIEKAARAGAAAVWVTERGTAFGYHDLVVDFRSVPILKGLGVPALVDCSHAIQSPAGAGDRSSGDSTMIPILARAAIAAGADGVFIEVHDNPTAALSDGPNSLALKDLEALLRKMKLIEEAMCTQ